MNKFLLWSLILMHGIPLFAIWITILLKGLDDINQHTGKKYSYYDIILLTILYIIFAQTFYYFSKAKRNSDNYNIWNILLGIMMFLYYVPAVDLINGILTSYDS